MLTPITAPTDEEAQAKLEDFYKYADTDAALTLFGGWTGIDMSKAADDEPLEHVESDAIRAMIDMLTRVDSEVVWTKKDSQSGCALADLALQWLARRQPSSTRWSDGWKLPMLTVSTLAGSLRQDDGGLRGPDRSRTAQAGPCPAGPERGRSHDVA